MALNEGASANTTWLNVANGKLVQRLQNPTDKTVERITKTGKVVHERSWKDLTATLVNATTKTNDYGKQWELEFKDGDERFIIRISASSRYATSFLKALPNVDLSKPVRFMPWEMTDKNDSTKTVTGITMYQDGEKVPPYYTKDNNNGLPEMKQIKVKGKMVWDSSDMDEFLENVANEIFGSVTSPATETADDDAPF